MLGSNAAFVDGALRDYDSAESRTATLPMTRLVETLHAFAPWLLWAMLAAGALLLVRAYRFWQLSWSGSGYKGITSVYWASLLLQVVNALLLIALGIVGLAGG